MCRSFGITYNQFLLYKWFLSCFVASCFREDLLICVFLSNLCSTASVLGGHRRAVRASFSFHSGHMFVSHSRGVGGQVGGHYCISREQIRLPLNPEHRRLYQSVIKSSSGPFRLKIASVCYVHRAPVYSSGLDLPLHSASVPPQTKEVYLLNVK